jgi:tetratricopeptide (TPR) repeat protein/mono/diheme cytochrome c family protein
MRHRPLVAGIGFAVLAAVVILTFAGPRRATPPEPGAVTFAVDVAPIVYQNCVACHRPGGAGPFELLTYDDARRNATRIARAVTTRTMPPWLPEPHHGEFVGERRLADREIELIRRWADSGAAEGDPARLPRPPTFPAEGEWALGKPDLIVRSPAPYTLAADGPDLYRNFVFPTDLNTRRYVRAVELRSGNARVVHHANLFVDTSGTARRRSDRAGGAGYDAMDPGDDVTRPEGSDLNWRPGRAPLIVNAESSWALPPGADLVLQTHLRRQGKPETLRPEIGLYLTDTPPASHVARLTLRSGVIDIPAGEANHVVEASYALPVDAEALGVFAHAHYLGKEVHGYATLPNGGGQVELLLIKRWNFNMQDSYAFRRPIPLPRGTVVHMRWTFDNSAANPVNPSSPPKRVFAGESSDDEMAELWVQLRMRDRADHDAFNADYAARFAMPDALTSLTARLTRLPRDADAHVDLAKLFLASGRTQEAERSLAAALRVDAAHPAAHYVLGHVAVARRDYAGAIGHFRQSLAAEPDNYRAQGDLALTLAMAGQLAESVAEFGKAVRLNPRDALTRVNLAKVHALQGNKPAAVAEVREALRLDPEHEQGRALARELDGR